MSRFSSFITLIFFVLFLAIPLVTLNSDFIAISIFCFILFIIDYFRFSFLSNIKIEARRQILLKENNEKIKIKNNRFNNNQIAIIETYIEIESDFPFFFKVQQDIPSELKTTSSMKSYDNIIINSFFYNISKNKKSIGKKNKFNDSNNSPNAIINKKNFMVSYEIKMKRGYYELDNIELKIFSPLFLNSKTIEIPAKLEFYSVPDEPIDIDLPIKSKKLSIYAGMIPAKKAGVGLNFFDVRKYYEGDRLNSINWKHSARTNQLYVNEFERESNTDVSIIIDCRNNYNTYSGYEEIFEKGIDAAYSIAKSMLKSQNRVSLLQFGSFFNYVRPEYGKVQLERIVQVLSRLKLSDTQDFWELDNIPISIIPSESLVFLITPLEDEDIPHIIRFHQKKYRFVIIALDIVEYTYKNYDDERKERYKKAYLLASSLRKATIELARKTGAVVLNYDCIQPFYQFIKENMFYLKELTKRAGKI